MALRGAGFSFLKKIGERAAVKREARKLGITEKEAEAVRMQVHKAEESAFKREFEKQKTMRFQRQQEQASLRGRQKAAKVFQQRQRPMITSKLVREDSILGKFLKGGRR